ncbi:MAG: class I SAM-dependent methyltransferase [Ignavibacteria bacterium]|jgi:ubiquinone/menaquinone biosynthesis C-methylase UbiE|nr:class I SAM-dependent methyltransferase [Ignavibacteria bacterium]
MNERVYGGAAHRLRREERLGRLEIEKVVELCTEKREINSLLDVGTGTGLFAEAFNNNEIAVSGVDLNAEFIELAKQYLPQSNLQIAYAEQLPFKDNSFDAAFFGLAFHEVDDFEKAMEEAYRVASKYAFILEWQYKEQEIGPPFSHRLKPDFISELAKKAGFSKIQEQKLTHLVLYSFEKNEAA